MTFSLTFSHVIAAPIGFKDIGNQDYYEFLGVDRNAPLDVIQAAFRTRMKSAHPDVNGGRVELAQFLNEAMDTLRQRRQEYDRWLNQRSPERTRKGSTAASADANRSTYKSTWSASPATPSNQKTEAEIQNDLFMNILVGTNTQVSPYIQRYGYINPETASEIAREQIEFFLEHLRNHEAEANYLFSLIHDYALNQEAYLKWHKYTLLAVAYGSIDLLKDRVYDTSEDVYPRHLNYLGKLRATLEHLMRTSDIESDWVKTMDSIYRVLERKSFYDQLYQEEYNAKMRRISPCERELTNQN